MPKTKTKKLTTPKRSNTTRKTKAKPKKGLAHHAKRLYRITPKFVHGAVVGAFIGVLVVVPLGRTGSVDALSIDTSKDCDSFSIIYCGVTSTTNLQKEYAKSNYVADVFRYFSISSANIDNIGKTAVKGTVYDNGKVSVNGKVVAINAVTAARGRVTNKDQKVNYSNSTFYTRKIEAGWSHKSAPAYVVMKSGVFDFAILASCGNPITAKPTTQPKPETTPKPAPTPTPATPTKPTSRPSQPTPTPTPTPPEKEDTNITPPSNKKTSVTMTAVTTLPKTGIGSLGIIFLIAAVCGTVFHVGHHHTKKRRHKARHTA